MLVYQIGHSELQFDITALEMSSCYMIKVTIPYLGKDIWFRMFSCYTIVAMKELIEQERLILMDKELRLTFHRVNLEGKTFTKADGVH